MLRKTVGLASAGVFALALGAVAVAPAQAGTSAGRGGTGRLAPG